MNTKFKLTGFCVSDAICTFICILPCDGAELGLMGLNWPLGLGIGSDLLWMYEFWDPSWKTYDFIEHAVFWAKRRSSKVQVQICYISKGFSKQQAYSYFTTVPLAQINIRFVPSHCIQKGESAISTKRRLVWLVRCDKLQINSTVYCRITSIYKVVSYVFSTDRPIMAWAWRLGLPVYGSIIHGSIKLHCI